MSALSIQVPFPVFNDRDGQPLENGYVWIGTANLYPITNAVPVFFDAALTIPAAQPLRTINGYISNAGTPAQVYVDGVNFSILVQDSKGSMVYSFPDGTGISPNADGIVYDPPFTGGVPTTVENKLAQTVSVFDFGAVGDGVVDDTAAIQAAFTAANGETLNIGDGLNFRITDQITMPENVSVTGTSEFTCDGDEDFWFFADTPTQIIWDNLNATVTLPGASRTKLNRVLRCEYATYVEVKNAYIDGATNAIHCLFGDQFVGGNIVLRNTYGWEGTDGKEGYGVNCSTKITNIYSIDWENADATEGRHPLYINGGIWENVYVNNIYVKNCKVFPISIVDGQTTKPIYCYIGTATFINANLGSSVASNGCINVSDEVPANARISVQTIRANNIGGPAFSKQGDDSGAYVGTVYAENLPTATFANTTLVSIRNGSGHLVGDIHCTALNTNWLNALTFRDASNSEFNNVYVGGSAGSYAVRLTDCTGVFLGNIVTPTITKFFETGSTFRYKQLAQSSYYDIAPPTTGTYDRGDITWNRAPSSGEPIGWVCLLAGTPGTWASFGSMTKKGTTAGRPTLTVNDTGVLYLDTTLDADGKPIFWTGTAWVDATGAVV